MHDKLKLIGFGCGITVSASGFHLMHEKVVKQEYGEGEMKEKFTDFEALVAIFCIVSYLVGLAFHYIFHEKEDTTRRLLYIISSICYASAMLCSNYSLNWMSYPTQIMAKCAAPLPTLILTTVIGRRRYKFRKYIFVILIVLGVGLFMFNQQKFNSSTGVVWWGEILLAGSLLFDGLSSGFLEKMRHESAPAPFSMMLNINGYSSIILIVSSLVTGEAISFFNFSTRYPEAFYYIFGMAVVSGITQIFIFLMTSHFGPLASSVTTTTRKFLSVIFSVIVFGHIILYYQWIGATMVFGGLFADIFYGDNKSNQSKDEKLEDIKEENEDIPLNIVQDPVPEILCKSDRNGKTWS